MLTTLSTVKARLAIPDADTTSDVILTSAIKAVSGRFDKECNRTFERTVAATHEFDADGTEICPACYPIEAITKWETKSSESQGWVEQPAPDYLIRSSCVISLSRPFSTYPLAFSLSLCRLTYTGGYLQPGVIEPPSAARLPDDLEQAAVDQVAYWFQKRDKLGVRISWPSSGTYQQFTTQDLLPSVQAVLTRYQRWQL
jgi:hypothetical protein